MAYIQPPSPFKQVEEEKKKKKKKEKKEKKKNDKSSMSLSDPTVEIDTGAFEYVKKKKKKKKNMKKPKGPKNKKSKESFFLVDTIDYSSFLAQ